VRLRSVGLRRAIVGRYGREGSVMKIAWALAGLLVGMCLILLAVALTPEIADGHGRAHPTYKTMLQGGDGAERHARTLWLGGAFGALQIAFFVGLVAFGGRRSDRLGRLTVPVLVVGGLYVATFVAMVFAYRAYAEGRVEGLVLSFPLPTALMLYGLWLVPLLLMIVYIALFDGWIYTPDDEARFRQILAARAERREGEP